MADWATRRATALAHLVGCKRATLPQQHTWRRSLGQASDPLRLAQALATCLQPPPSADPPARGSVMLAVDGKTLRGTMPLGQTQGVHLVAAYVPEHGVVLAHLAVDYTANELVIVPTLLAQLDVAGTVVVGDALQTHRDVRSQIVEPGGADLGSGTENQPTLRAAIEEVCVPPPITPGQATPPRDFMTAQRVEQGHGRLEARVLTAREMRTGSSDWPSLAQVFKRERTVWQHGQQMLDAVRSGLTRLPRRVADAERLVVVARAAWGSEHGLHERRAVTLPADACQVRRGDGPQVMAALNNAVICWLGQHQEAKLAAVQRRCADQFDRWLAHLRIEEGPLSTLHEPWQPWPETCWKRRCSTVMNNTC